MLRNPIPPSPPGLSTDPTSNGGQSVSGAVPASVRAQLLATEHWSLLATRTTTQNEVLSRISTFLMLVSSSIVSLALIGQFTRFDGRFITFALVLVGALVVIGFLTQMRVGNASLEDLAHVIGMNRLRAAYLEMDPAMERFLITSARDDAPGVWQTYNPLLGRHMGSNVLASSGSFITFVTAGLTCAFGALVAFAFGASGWVIGVVAGASGVLFIAVSLLLGVRKYRGLKRTEMFPAPKPQPVATREV